MDSSIPDLDPYSIQKRRFAEIERGRGTAYDPAVADACLRLFREKGYVLPG